MISNHPHLSIIISFICTDTNNRMIKNHPHLFANENTSSKNPTSFTQFRLHSHTIIHTEIHPHTSVNKTLQKTPTYAFHYYLYLHLSSARNFFVTTFIKTLHNFWKHENLDTRFYRRDRMGKTEEPRTVCQ